MTSSHSPPKLRQPCSSAPRMTSSDSPPKLVDEEPCSKRQRYERQLVVHNNLEQTNPVIYFFLTNCMFLDPKLINQKKWIEIDLLEKGIDEGSRNSIYQQAIDDPTNSILMANPFGIQQNSAASFTNMLETMQKEFSKHEDLHNANQVALMSTIEEKAAIKSELDVLEEEIQRKISRRDDLKEQLAVKNVEHLNYGQSIKHNQDMMVAANICHATIDMQKQSMGKCYRDGPFGGDSNLSLEAIKDKIGLKTYGDVEGLSRDSLVSMLRTLYHGGLTTNELFKRKWEDVTDGGSKVNGLSTDQFREKYNRHPQVVTKLNTIDDARERICHYLDIKIPKEEDTARTPNPNKFDWGSLDYEEQKGILQQFEEMIKTASAKKRRREEE